MTFIDCYKILEIPNGASWSEVKQAYRTLAKKYHPDKTQDDLVNSSRFQEISRAYQILDRYYRKNKKRNGSNLPNWSLIPYHPPENVSKLGDDHEGGGPADCSRLSFMEKVHQRVFQLECSWFPLDVYQGVTVGLQTASSGGVIRISTAREVFNVKLPTNVRHGTQLRIASRGQRSWFYDKRGDLYIKLRVIPSDAIRPGTANLFYEMEIRKEDLGLGRVFTLHTLQGPIKFFPPKKTQDGQVFILKYRPDEQRSKKLNHILTVKLV